MPIFDRLAVFSPMFTAGVVTLAGLSLTLFPVAKYEELLREKNYMFLNSNLWTFTLLCLIFFEAGCLIAVNFIKKIRVPEMYRSELLNARWVAIVKVVCLVAILATYLKLWITISNIGIGNSLAAFVGNSSLSITDYRKIYDESLSSSAISWIFPFSFVCFSWGLWEIVKKNDKFLTSLVLLGYLGMVLQSLLSQTRGSLLLILGGIFLIYFSQMLDRGKISHYRLLVYVFLAVSIASLLFVLIDLRRGGLLTTSTGFSTTLVGYFVSEFNRLALILEGDLSIPNNGQQTYAFYNLLYPPLSSKIHLLNFGDILGFKQGSYSSAWLESFYSIRRAGLNENFNWYTIYGSIFSDLRWLSPLWFLGYGLLSGFFWKLFLLKNGIGLAVYPWMWITILTWWGAFNVLISSPDTFLIVFFGVVISSLKSISFKQRS